MSSVGVPREAERLEALRGYEILDTPPDGAFDRVTALAARHFHVPVALVTLVDEDRIWFKSRYGLEAQQIPRSPGLCASAILSDEAYVVTNALEDPRALANPLVAGELGLRFYAAAPLLTHDGYRLGTMNIIDFKPRELDDNGRWALQQFAGLVMDQMELRLSARKAIASLSQVYRGAEQGTDVRQLITVSAWSRKIQVEGEWLSFEDFLVSKLGAAITHGIDPETAGVLNRGLDPQL
ncbi:MAG: GAF domain-containing protein [Gemmatimonadales bacterium]|nr:GAF domain-containing protein [Gemmatimonadales bacterium]